MKILKICRTVTLCVFIWVLTSCSTNEHQEDAAHLFSTMTISKTDVTINKSYSASICGRQDIKIVPRVDGYLTSVLVKEGEIVRKGQPLFVIDQVSYNANLQSAKANVAVSEANIANAELTYQSKKALFEKNIVSKFELSAAENELKTAQALLLQAKAQEDVALNNLSFTVIKSPSDGVVGNVPYRTGDYVSTATQEGLTVISDNSQIYVYFSMTENELRSLVREYGTPERLIKQMPEIELQLNDGTRYESKGHIESISGIINTQTGTASVRGVFPNKNRLLWSGSIGSVIIPQKFTDVVVIPQNVVGEIQDKLFVFKAVEGKAKRTFITAEKINDGKKYIIRQGLELGDVIVTEGAGVLTDDMPIQIKTEKH
ncbi:MAG: efflux RND transporter periplasmic adaptor subunit [Paludibacteraceae bacterium]